MKRWREKKRYGGRKVRKREESREENDGGYKCALQSRGGGHVQT